MLDTFFAGSESVAMAALLEMRSEDLSREERRRMQRVIDRLRAQEEEEG